MKRISSHRKFSLRAKVLRLLKMNRGFEEISNSLEGTIHFAIPISPYHNYQKEIETGLLEAECKKAEALMESRRHHFIC